MKEKELSQEQQEWLVALAADPRVREAIEAGDRDFAEGRFTTYHSKEEFLQAFGGK